jgi:transcriptional accessory protein Tex/SPT6
VPVINQINIREIDDKYGIRKNVTVVAELLQPILTSISFARCFKESYENLKAVQEKCSKLLSTLEKAGKSSPAVRQALTSARSLSELDHAYAPFKTGSKASLAERARKLGLEPTAFEILDGTRFGWDVAILVDQRVAGRTNVAEVEAGLQHILADIIVHDKTTCDLVRDLQRQARIELQVKRASAATAAAAAKGKSVKSKATTKRSAPESNGKSSKANPEEEAKKFENYFSFSCPVAFVKPHQVLAINRGESLKILSVKVVLPDGWLMGQLERHLRLRQVSPSACIVPVPVPVPVPTYFQIQKSIGF